jgi:hypothetical protein
LDGGVVTPSSTVVPYPLGVENGNATSATSSTASRKGSSSSRASGQTAPLERASAQAFYDDDLTDAHAAYPGMRIWRHDGGMWLMTESTVTTGLKKAATFLTALNTNEQRVKSWGFWRESAVQITWIGPRHTNFNDGSVCAFEPTDGTWSFGDPLVELLDLYSVWAMRHLHFELFDRWPGGQFAHHAYEHHRELHRDELCGCGSTIRYSECCSNRDRAIGPIAAALDFARTHGSWTREPPPLVVVSARERTEPPPIMSLQWPRKVELTEQHVAAFEAGPGRTNAIFQERIARYLRSH